MLKKSIKRLIPLAVALAISIPGAMTLAAENTKEKNAQNPYSVEIKAVKSTIKSNREANRELKESIKKKKENAKVLIKDLKDSGKFETKRSEIETKRTVIKQDEQDIKSVNEKLKAKFGEVKQDKESKNYEELLKDLKEIPTLQEQKKPLLEKLSKDMDSLIEVLN